MIAKEKSQTGSCDDQLTCLEHQARAKELALAFWPLGDEATPSKKRIESMTQAGFDPDLLCDVQARAVWAAIIETEAEAHNVLEVADAASVSLDDAMTAIEAHDHTLHKRIRELEDEHRARRVRSAILAAQEMHPDEACEYLSKEIRHIQSTGGAIAGRLVDSREWFNFEPDTEDHIIYELFSTGDKVALFGKSKMRKSLSALQIAGCIATGRSWCGFKVPKKRAVLYVQLEIKANNMHKRFRLLCEGMHITPDAIDGRLFILNGRGAFISMQSILNTSKQVGAELIIVDPLYKMDSGDEGAEALAEILAGFDHIIEQTGAALLYVHHDKKGSVGEMDAVDRGSGHGVVGRDYDTSIMLTRHEDGESTLAEFVCRNHATPDPRCLTWEDFHFQVVEDASTVPETSRTLAQRRSRGPTNAELAERAAEMIQPGHSLDMNTFRVRVQDAFSIGQHKARDVIRLVTERDEYTAETTKTFPAKTIITRAE